MLMGFRYLIYIHQRIHDWFKMYGIMLSIDQRTLVRYFNAWSFCLFVFCCCCCFSNRWSTRLFWSKRFLWSLLSSIKCVLTVRERRPTTFGKLSCKCDKRWLYQTWWQTDRQTDKLADATKSILYIHCSMTNGIFSLGVPQENIFLSGAVNTEEHSSL